MLLGLCRTPHSGVCSCALLFCECRLHVIAVGSLGLGRACPLCLWLLLHSTLLGCPDAASWDLAGSTLRRRPQKVTAWISAPGVGCLCWLRMAVPEPTDCPSVPSDWALCWQPCAHIEHGCCPITARLCRPEGPRYTQLCVPVARSLCHPCPVLPCLLDVGFGTQMGLHNCASCSPLEVRPREGLSLGGWWGDVPPGAMEPELVPCRHVREFLCPRVQAAL